MRSPTEASADRISTGVSICAARSALQHRQAVEHRQHAVEDDEVEAAVGGAEQAVLAVGRLLDAMALLGQALGEIGGGFAIVLDQQDLAAHEPSVRRPS